MSIVNHIFTATVAIDGTPRMRSHKGIADPSVLIAKKIGPGHFEVRLPVSPADSMILVDARTMSWGLTDDELAASNIVKHAIRTATIGWGIEPKMKRADVWEIQIRRVFYEVSHDRESMQITKLEPVDCGFHLMLLWADE